MSHLETDFNVLRERAFGEHGLDLRNDSRRNHSAFVSDRAGLLSHASHDGKVMRKVRRQDSRYSLLIQLLGTLQIYMVVKKRIPSFIFGITLVIQRRC